MNSPSRGPSSNKPYKRMTTKNSTVACAIIGLLCVTGVILGILDPSSSGHTAGSAGSSLSGPADIPNPDADLGPALRIPSAAQALKTEPAPELDKEALVEKAAREARADELIGNLLSKIRAEKAERKKAREQASE